MPRWAAVVLALCLLAGAVVGSAGLGTATAQQRPGFNLAQEFDRAQFQIAVYPNGSARWTFHFERTLVNDSERNQFEGFAENFNTNETTLYRDFQNQSRTLVRRGESATGRAMAARAFSRQAFVTTQLNEVGVVEMGFTWNGFAPTENDRVVVGDVFEGGLYVGPDQSLVVRAAGGLRFQTVEPTATLSASTLAESDTVTWEGERTFTDNHPRVVLTTAPLTASPTAVERTTAQRTTEMVVTTATGEGSPLWPVGLVLLVILGAIGAFLYRRRGGSIGIPTGGGVSGGTPTSIDGTALLDDDERIEALLRDHGGRMRQSALVQETEWSKSKVSMVLSEMEEADQVRKLRVGRENIVSLPGHEPDATRSSLEDDEE